MMTDLTALNIAITGASSGIGKACAIQCNKAGARVHLIGRDLVRLEDVRSGLLGDGNSCHVLDLHCFDGYQGVIDSIVNSYGKINGFIHSAGYQIVAPIKSTTADQYIDIFQINTISAFEFSRILTLKKYCSDKGLSIVFISSVMSVAANSGLTAYCASKAALVGGCRAMAIELASKKIRVNCISPGTISDTAMTDNLQDQLTDSEFSAIVRDYPLGLGKTQDISSMCVYLLSSASAWITGQNIVIDGGYSAK